jgi:aminoglycoside N3'-acetyltransferase
VKQYSLEEMHNALVRVGVSPGRVLLVHSSLAALGPITGLPPGRIPEEVYRVLQAALGNDGTVVVPTFTFAFCDGVPFDPKVTPSDGMGILSEYVRERPDAHRSAHPMQSVAAVGAAARDVCDRDTCSAFAKDGPFDRMLQLDATLVLLGAPVQAASLVHYAEERAQVPYRYWKSFTAPYGPPGRAGVKTYWMYVRDLGLDPRLDLSPLADELRSCGALQSQPLGSGWIHGCTARDFVDVCSGLLGSDPWFLVPSRARRGGDRSTEDQE